MAGWKKSILQHREHWSVQQSPCSRTSYKTIISWIARELTNLHHVSDRRHSLQHISEDWGLHHLLSQSTARCVSYLFLDLFPIISCKCTQSAIHWNFNCGDNLQSQSDLFGVTDLFPTLFSVGAVDEVLSSLGKVPLSEGCQGKRWPWLSKET